jgi:hypothetical protein
MLETPDDFGRRTGSRYPSDNLTGYRYHTGATLRPLRSDEVCPVLFRDLGPVALARFLRGQLRRLAGPQSPIVYMRTEEYVEPYTDHERIGRIVFLQSLVLQPWHSGEATIYVARALPAFDAGVVDFVPGDVPLATAARLARDVTDVRQLREVLGGRGYEEATAETLRRLDGLAEELARTEEMAAPLRRRLQAPDGKVREQARAEMERVGLTESDLCTAWHHLSRERRGLIGETLRLLAPEFVTCF